MKFVGVIESGTKEDPFERLLPADNGQRERIIPHSSKGTSSWLTGYITNRSPTYFLYIDFYNSARELQQVAIPPISQLIIKNQNAERIIFSSIDNPRTTISTGDPNVHNPRLYASYQYNIAVTVAETDEEAGSLLDDLQLEIKHLNPLALYNQVASEQAVVLFAGGVFTLVDLPTDRQIWVFDLTITHSSGLGGALELLIRFREGSGVGVYNEDKRTIYFDDTVGVITTFIEGYSGNVVGDGTPLTITVYEAAPIIFPLANTYSLNIKYAII